MLVPRVSCTLQRLNGSDQYGKEKLKFSVPIYCAVVKLSESSQKTSVRADSSGSRGKAIESTSDARLLFLPATDIKLGDRINIAGISLKVETVHTRFNIAGRVDHLQVDLAPWA